MEAAVASRSPSRTTAVPSSSGCADAAGGSTQSISRSSSRKNGEPRPIGCTAEQRSWTKPGSVSSALLVPPPMVSAASCTSTSRPACASVTAAASPFGPEPMTTASGSEPRPDDVDREWHSVLAREKAEELPPQHRPFVLLEPADRARRAIARDQLARRDHRLADHPAFAWPLEGGALERAA